MCLRYNQNEIARVCSPAVLARVAILVHLIISTRIFWLRVHKRNQRHYTFDNMELADNAEDESETHEDNAENPGTNQQDTTHKRKKRKASGRVPKESDFWASLEVWWKGRIDEWGNSLDDSASWRRSVVSLLIQAMRQY